MNLIDEKCCCPKNADEILVKEIIGAQVCAKEMPQDKFFSMEQVV
jgi:hypothetical protein